MKNVPCSTYESASPTHSHSRCTQDIVTYALRLLSLPYLHQSLSGNGFERRSFLNFRVHALACPRLSQLNSRAVLHITPWNGPQRKSSPNISPIVASRNCCTDRVENTASQLVHWCMLRICCGYRLTTAVVYRAIT
jgi:hypothetical protein